MVKKRSPIVPVSALTFFALCVCAPKPEPGRLEPSTASTAPAQPVAAFGFVFPAKVRRYALTETNPVEGQPQTAAFRYSDGSPTRVSVFFYPADSAMHDARAIVAQEGQLFLQTLPLGVQRGWYDSYTTAFSDPDSVVVKGQLFVGNATVAATKRAGNINVELQYVYLLGARLVKVRGSVPAEGWQNTDVPRFARELASALALQLH